MDDISFVMGAYIQEGLSPIPGVLIAVSTLVEEDDPPRSRVGVRKNGSWLDFGFKGDAVLSVDAAPQSRGYALCEQGTVVEFNWNAPDQAALKASRRAINNPAVQKIGPLRRLRILGNDVITAGSAGQAYVLSQGTFQALPRLMVGPEALTIEDIDGTSARNILAVTSDGYLAHFDGQSWSIEDFPSNASQTSLCRIGEGHYLVSGKNGLLAVGALGSWVLIPGTDTELNYWGVGSFGDELYAAHLGGIHEVRMTGVSDIPIAGKEDLQFTVLRSAQDGVWSFADRTIGRIAQRRWTTEVS